MSNQPLNMSMGIKSQAKWFLDIFFRPKRAFQQISEKKNGVWLLPLLIMSVLAIGYASASARANVSFAFDGMQGIDIENSEIIVSQDGEDLQYDLSEAEKISSMPESSVFLDSIGSIFRIWLSWGVLAIVLYLSITLFGGRTENIHLLNMVAWSGMPLALRDFIRIVTVNFMHKPIINPGLSGFVLSQNGYSSLFWNSFLGIVDIYLIWSLVLLVFGGKEISQLNFWKSIKSVLIPAFLLLIIYSLTSAELISLSLQIKEGVDFAEGF